MIGPVSYTVAMAMGASRGRTRQATMWVPTADLPKSAGHPFYERLNRVLDEAGFDTFVGHCQLIEGSALLPREIDAPDRFQQAHVTASHSTNARVWSRRW